MLSFLSTKKVLKFLPELPINRYSRETQTERNKMKTTKIKGYKVEFTIIDDSSQCYIEKGKFFSSLVVAMDLGILEDREGREHKISECVVEEIYEWALAQGY